jgi:hypothetical protein
MAILTERQPDEYAGAGARDDLHRMRHHSDLLPLCAVQRKLVLERAHELVVHLRQAPADVARQRRAHRVLVVRVGHDLRAHRVVRLQDLRKLARN